ncbi:Holliday junction branch migration protein RuvA [Pseudobacteroides cellulosolvens]|uniref:Holliday junction branch migration complex subunit RuvA n=1 Tax=Pseudobacteroides cellulosolvens ATCC 35603 = DSM 2933 TaxID=398512 RepID=A0A0L6JR60_9FIRM|nr:Holliday junction branch migration protein RuvA [Pseudobacteroides cellulosolvens]KNY28258.1 Holliday junction ATP-dependent DNA helicase ruvA [Pseudobacteroides cellulosolvens ATCC 35603 = DSM 2933]
MIAYIKGTLEIKSNDYMIVDVNGIGYRINTSITSIEKAGAIGDGVKVYTHLYVREDIMSLYGFITREELNLFEMLISVSGVGPKAALAVISSVPVTKFGLAVITDDVKALTKAPGIGNKMAQRIILELKDKIKKEQLVETAVGDTGLEGGRSDNGRAGEAISALIVLGYTPLEASKAVNSVYSEEMDLESIVKNALKSLMR